MRTGGDAEEVELRAGATVSVAGVGTAAGEISRSMLAALSHTDLMCKDKQRLLLRLRYLVL